LATSSEQPESAHTLPRPELNPLLNPLLAENMGRWAEVYFTAPVEKREEAVLELLHKLEAAEEVRANAPASRGVLDAVPRAEVRGTMLESASLPTSIAQDSSTRCPSCGHENPASYQFCGMCGATFEPPAKAAGVAAGISSEGAAFRPELHSGETQSMQSHEDYTPREEYYEPLANPHELSLFRSLKGRDGDYDLDYAPPPSRPYRYYIGAVLAIVIAVLAYMAWRSELVVQSKHQPAAPPPTAVAETGTVPAESSKQNKDTATPPASNETHPKLVTELPPTKTPPAASNRAAQETPRNEPVEKTSAIPPAAAASAERPVSGNGSEELAMAQRYLSGGNGLARDGAEASKWLWKSIAKHNGEATLLLADLYLRGEGVSKNCDQARVLLDSAARKGVAGATERLRNLRAFGCP